MPMLFHHRHTAFLTAMLFLMTGCLHAAAPEPRTTPADQVAQRLTEEKLGTLTGQIPMPADLLQKIVRDRLDARLLEENPDIQGTDLRFVLPDVQDNAQIVILTLTYPDHAIALRQSERLAALKQYFRKSIVLTRFAHAVPDDRLVILFTENAGNDRIVAFIDACAAALATGQTRPLPVR